MSNLNINPWGFLGLLGIAVLILIYILKPNYQQRVVSTTYVWKLSLKRRKKKIPISKFRNILIIICQILIISLCAFIFAQPFLSATADQNRNEKVIIIDASANMNATTDGVTRFERAVEKAREIGGKTISEQGIVTLILAGQTADFVPDAVTTESMDALTDALDGLIIPGELKCSYGVADIDGAMTKAGEIRINPNAEIVFITGTEYIDDGGATIINVADENEWNAAVLSCTAEIVDNYYAFSIDVACYGTNLDLKVRISVNGANADEDNPLGVSDFPPLERTASCRDGLPFKIYVDELPVYSFKSVLIEILGAENDSFSADNSFYLYGGVREKLKIQYTTSLTNPFYSGVLDALRVAVSDRFDITVDEIKTGAMLEGYDFYIFEHEMPKAMPVDGVVLLIDPDSVPLGSDFSIGDKSGDRKTEMSLTAGSSHAITTGVNVPRITVTEYTKVIYNASSGFVPLMYCGDDPVLLAKKEPYAKIAIMPFSIHMSNLSMLFLDFNRLMLNLFNYYLPSTITDFVYDVGEPITLNARAESLEVSGPGISDTYHGGFPREIILNRRGSYTLTQQTLIEKFDISFFVKVPSTESNLMRVEPDLKCPESVTLKEDINKDLLIYLAAALVALLFIEWWLQSREA